MGTFILVIFGGTMTLLNVITTGLVSPSFRLLDLTKDMEAHEEGDN